MMDHAAGFGVWGFDGSCRVGEGYCAALLHQLGGSVCLHAHACVHSILSLLPPPPHTHTLAAMLRDGELAPAPHAPPTSPHHQMPFVTAVVLGLHKFEKYPVMRYRPSRSLQWHTYSCKDENQLQRLYVRGSVRSLDFTLACQDNDEVVVEEVSKEMDRVLVRRAARGGMGGECAGEEGGRGRKEGQGCW